MSDSSKHKLGVAVVGASSAYASAFVPASLPSFRHARCSPAIVSLRAAGGFGEKPKQDTKKSEPVVKVSLDEKAADPKKALDADVEEMRKAMGGGGSTTIKGFEDG